MSKVLLGACKECRLRVVWIGYLNGMGNYRKFNVEKNSRKNKNANQINTNE
jgi:hypothetical protein